AGRAEPSPYVLADIAQRPLIRKHRVIGRSRGVNDVIRLCVLDVRALLELGDELRRMLRPRMDQVCADTAQLSSGVSVDRLCDAGDLSSVWRRAELDDDMICCSVAAMHFVVIRDAEQLLSAGDNEDE